MPIISRHVENLLITNKHQITVTSSWFYYLPTWTMHGHTNIKPATSYCKTEYRFYWGQQTALDLLLLWSRAELCEGTTHTLTVWFPTLLHDIIKRQFRIGFQDAVASQFNIYWRFSQPDLMWWFRQKREIPPGPLSRI